MVVLGLTEFHNTIMSLALDILLRRRKSEPKINVQLHDFNQIFKRLTLISTLALEKQCSIDNLTIPHQ